MNPFSTPYENVLSVLSTSDAWKKYFPGIQKGGLEVAYKESKKDEVPSMKGIDFTTGKNVDLGKYLGDKGTDVSSFWNPAAAEPSSNALTPPTYSEPASPLDEEAIKRIIDYQRGQTSRTRAEEAGYNLGMMYPLQKAVTDTALLVCGKQIYKTELLVKLLVKICLNLLLRDQTYSNRGKPWHLVRLQLNLVPLQTQDTKTKWAL
jgi:hypothetical protein